MFQRRKPKAMFECLSKVEKLNARLLSAVAGAEQRFGDSNEEVVGPL
jgi:hypothetical protein